MNRVTEIFHRALAVPENDRRAVVGSEAAWLCVDTDKAQCLPHFGDEFVDVQPFAGRDGHGHGNLVSGQEIRLLEDGKI